MNADHLHIAEPCNADWDGMDEQGASRFCSSCEKSVHDLSAMSEGEATALLEREKGLCVRYTRGADGVIRHRPAVGVGSVPPSMLERGLRNGLRIGLGLVLVAGGPVLASTAGRPSEGGGEPGLIELALETLKSLVEEAEPVVMMGDVAYEPVVEMGEIEAVVEPEFVMMGKPAMPMEVIMGGVTVPEPAVVLEPVVDSGPAQVQPVTSHTSYE